MARIDNKGVVRGTAGSVIYRGYRDMNIIQGKPKKFKQTAESIKASTEFGLSSTTAAVIRHAFQPAYIHRDGEAVSRCTQIVYRSIRGSQNCVVGERDLHDADLNCFAGMEFNINSKLSEVLQTSYRVEKNSEGCITVLLAGLDAKKDLRVPTWISKAANRYRIRLTLIGFNFRKEYYEFLDVKDIDLRKSEMLEGQTLCFNRKAEPDQLLLLSISLLAYRYTPMEEGYILLNSKEFSPSAIIAAFPAEEPDEYPVSEVNLELSEDQMNRQVAICMMCYNGNRLLRNLPLRIKSKASKIKPPKDPDLPLIKAGHRVSFKKV